MAEQWILLGEYIETADGYPVCRISTCATVASYRRARLILAAPRLLESCQDMVRATQQAQDYRFSSRQTLALSAIENAIKQVEGEQ